MGLRIGGSSVKLLITVVNSDDTYSLIDALSDAEYRATVISTTGGFLRQGNSTLLIGVDDERLAGVLQVIQDTCHSRTTYLNAFPTPVRPMEALASVPMQVQVGGAVVFALDVERFVKF
jgi:uncharacterized protein YaaQ